MIDILAFYHLAGFQYVRFGLCSFHDFLVTLAAEGDCEGMFISVCLSVCARNLKTIAPIDFICLDNLLYFTYPLLSSLGYQILLKVQYERFVTN